MLRGLFSAHVKAGLEEMLSTETQGKLTTLDDRPTLMVSMEEEWRTAVASMDVITGLERLCATVSRARSLFPLVEPPAVKFNRTLVLLVCQAVRPGEDLHMLWNRY
jgi:hypothetical protein